MKTRTIIACEKCQRIKRFLEWKHFDDLNQLDKAVCTLEWKPNKS